MLYERRSNKNTHSYESIRTVVEVKPYVFLVRVDQSIDLFIEEDVALNRLIGQFRRRNSFKQRENKRI